MVTHSMTQALQLGNRLVMMHMGQIIFDIHAKEKQHLTKADLLQRFNAAQGEAFFSDRMLLS